MLQDRLKKIGLAVLCGGAIVAFIFVYQKDIRGHQADALAGANQGNVVHQVQPTVDSTVLPTKVSDYNDIEALKHLNLTAINVIWFTNYYRVKNGLQPLTERWRLDNSAMLKINDMFAYQYFDHIRPYNNVGFDTFINEQNYDFIKIGENLAMGDFRTAREVVDAWMASAPHRRNMLSQTYVDIGVSIRFGSMRGKQVMLIAEHLGQPRRTCPSIDSSVKTSIDTLTNQIKGIQDDITTKGSTDPGYGGLVNDYNIAADHLSELVKQYNAEVKAFDSCIAGQS